MTRTYLISDTHFGHANILTFKRDDGVPLRSFSSVEEMDEHMIQQWNSVVNDGDRVYHLGDVVMNRRYLHTLSRLKGRLCLIKGNHDIFKLKDYLPFFDDVRSACILEGCMLTHIPIHPASLRRFGCNIHGHLHHGRVLVNEKHGYTPSNIDTRYHCVSVEMIDYTPIEWGELKDRIREEGGSTEMRSREEIYGG